MLYHCAGGVEDFRAMGWKPVQPVTRHVTIPRLHTKQKAGDQLLCLGDLLRLETEICHQLHVRLDPKLCFAVGMLNVDVSPPFLSGEKVEPNKLPRPMPTVACTALPIPAR
jgi:hypothetical protein